MQHLARPLPEPGFTGPRQLVLNAVQSRARGGLDTP